MVGMVARPTKVGAVGSFHTLILSLSLCFISLSQFSVRATFGAYVAILLLAIFRSPRLLGQMNGVVGGGMYLILITAAAFLFSAFHDIYFNSFIKFFLLQIYVVLLYWMVRARILSMETIANACKLLIYVHVTFFLVQLGYYLVSGNFIDFDSYVRETAADSLYESKALDDSIIPIRAVGLFSEPSFYAMTVVPAGVIVLLKQRKMSLAVLLAFGTAFLSFSIAAIAITALILLIHMAFGRVSMRLKVAVVVAAVLCTPPLYTIYDKRVNQSVDYNAVDSRTAVFDELRVRDPMETLFGNGVFWDENNTVGKTQLVGYQVRDSSFYVYVVFGTGLVGATLFFGFLLFLFRKKPARKYFIYLFPILLFKYFVLSGFLWPMLMFFYLLGKEPVPPQNRVLSLAG